LQTLKLDYAVFITFMISGVFVLLTAAVGGVAVASKNNFMAMLVRLGLTEGQYGFFSLVVMLVFLGMGSAIFIIKGKLILRCSLGRGGQRGFQGWMQLRQRSYCRYASNV